MSDEEKITVISKGENPVVTVLKGRDYTMLEDLSYPTFKTQDFDSFVEYLKRSSECTEHRLAIAVDEPIYVNIKDPSSVSCSVYNTFRMDRRTCTPSAMLDFFATTELLFFIQCLGKKMSLKETYQNLRTFVQYGDEDLLSVVVFCKECGFSTLTKFENLRDDRGNFTCNVSRSQQGTFKNPFPEDFEVKLPLFDHEYSTITLPVTTIIDYEQKEHGVDVWIKLECVNLNRIVDESVKTSLWGILDKKKLGEHKVLFGSIDINKYTNRDLINYNS